MPPASAPYTVAQRPSTGPTQLSPDARAEHWRTTRRVTGSLLALMGAGARFMVGYGPVRWRLMTSKPLDPIAEAHRQWMRRWPEHAEHMAAITSVMRVQQILLGEVERALKPYGLTFASYEALTLLHFSRTGRLPLGKMGERLMVHPTSVTNTIDRLQAGGLVERVPDPDDRRRVLAEITQRGHEVAAAATAVLNGIDFGLGYLDRRDATALSALLRQIRLAAGDFDAETPDPWSATDPS